MNIFHFVVIAVVFRGVLGEIDGINLSDNDDDADWNSLRSDGISFCYVFATYGSDAISETFNDQYNGARDAGVYVGAYHVATPGYSGGEEQAQYFYDNGGQWSSDGQTLPGAVLLTDESDESACYDLNPEDMINWIRDFANKYEDINNQKPVIWTDRTWWNKCTDRSNDFKDYPLWISRLKPSAGTLPAKWDDYIFWEFEEGEEGEEGEEQAYPGYKMKYNGDMDDLQEFASGS